MSKEITQKKKGQGFLRSCFKLVTPIVAILIQRCVTFKILDSSRSSSSKDSKEEGATGGKTNPMDKDDITAMMIVPGRYEETKDGKKKEPSVEDIR